MRIFPWVSLYVLLQMALTNFGEGTFFAMVWTFSTVYHVYYLEMDAPTPNYSTHKRRCSLVRRPFCLNKTVFNQQTPGLVRWLLVRRPSSDQQSSGQQYHWWWLVRRPFCFGKTVFRPTLHQAISGQTNIWPNLIRELRALCMGSDVRLRPFWDLTNITLADEDTIFIITNWWYQ